MLLEETPNTLGYLIAGYVVLFGVPFLYVVSWLLRQRNLEKDIEVIKTLTEDKQKSP